MALETVIVLKRLNSLISYTVGLTGFRDELAAIMLEIGEADYETALEALNDSKLSNDPAREINNAAHSLRGAYVKFRKAAEMTSLRTILQDHRDLFLFDAHWRKVAGYKRAYTTAILMADCFYSINDPPLVLDYVNKSKCCYEKYWDALKQGWNVFHGGEEHFWQSYGVSAVEERMELTKNISVLSKKLPGHSLTELPPPPRADVYSPYGSFVGKTYDFREYLNSN